MKSNLHFNKINDECVKGLDEAQAGIKIAGRNINNLRYADDIILMAESKEELKNFLMRVKVSFLHSPTLTSIHNHWKNHSLDWTDLCWQSAALKEA